MKNLFRTVEHYVESFAIFLLCGMLIAFIGVDDDILYNGLKQIKRLQPLYKTIIISFCAILIWSTAKDL